MARYNSAMRHTTTKSICAVFLSFALGMPLFAGETNAVYNELVNQGVALSNSKTIKLPEPMMADGLKTDTQQAVLKEVGPKNNKDNMQRFLRGNPADWYEIKQSSEKGSNAADSIGRRIDLYFIAKGKLETLASDGFMKEQLKTEKKTGEADSTNTDQKTDASKVANDKQGPKGKIEFYTDEELNKKKMTTKNTDNSKEQFAHAQLTPDDLFGKVQVTGGGYGIETRNPESVLIAFKLDPRFDKDPTYPNQYQTAKIDPNGKMILGPAKRYSGFAGYAKFTKLPDNKIFVEYHLIYDEPYEWFNGTAELASKLETSYTDNIKKFRRNLIEYEKTHSAPAKMPIGEDAAK
jgi:hypothetical protein